MHNQNGFTLVELMVTISVAAIISSVGIPSFAEMIDNNRTTAMANSWHAALLYARSESVKRNQRVTICLSTSGTKCTNSASWTDGWIMFVDSNSDGAYAITEELLRYQASESESNSLVRTDSSDNYVSYVPTGSLETVDGVIVNSEWVLCTSRKDNTNAKFIAVSNNGRAKVKKKPFKNKAACA